MAQRAILSRLRPLRGLLLESTQAHFPEAFRALIPCLFFLGSYRPILKHGHPRPVGRRPRLPVVPDGEAEEIVVRVRREHPTEKDT